jgi:hypothetical protein
MTRRELSKGFYILPLPGANRTLPDLPWPDQAVKG